MADDPIKDVVWYLLKYDIGFCLYFFFAGACPAVMSYLWYEIPDDCEGNVNMGGGAVLFLAWMYVVLEFFYCCCFVCGAGAKDKAGKLFAIIHMIFAFYIQRRLVAKIEQMADDPIKDVVWYLLKYDIGFCLYFFFAGACPAVMSYLWYEIPDDCESRSAPQLPRLSRSAPQLERM